MKKIHLTLASACLLAFATPLFSFAAESPRETPAKIRVLIVTGGHNFEKDAFFKMFADNPDITYEAVEHPNAHERLKASAPKYDVLVLYDMYQEITQQAKTDFVERLKEGRGLVVLHHAIADYQEWPEYRKIIGARYYLKQMVVDGVEKKRSAFKHDMHFRIQVIDPWDPVTKGVTDFDMHDETYKWFDVAQDSHPILATSEPESNMTIGWTRTYGPARIVYMQSGHDHFAYENSSYQRLLRQAIRWTAHRN